MRSLLPATLAILFAADAGWAQPGVPPLPPPPKFTRPPPLPRPPFSVEPLDRATQPFDVAPFANAPAGNAPLPYEPPPPRSHAEKRLRDLVVGFVVVAPLGLAGLGLIALTQWKKPALSGRLYARGIGLGTLLVLASLVLAATIVVRLLGYDFHLSDLWD